MSDADRKAATKRPHSSVTTAPAGSSDDRGDRTRVVAARSSRSASRPRSATAVAVPLAHPLAVTVLHAPSPPSRNVHAPPS